MVMSARMTSARPWAAGERRMLGPQARRLNTQRRPCAFFKHELCLFRMFSEQMAVYSLLFSGCFVTWLLLLVVFDAKCSTYRLGCRVCYLWHFLSRSVWTTSLLPVCGLSVSAAAAVMFILSATPPPPHTETCNTQALLRTFNKGLAGVYWRACRWIVSQISISI